MRAPLHSEREGTGPRVVLVHGFTQTGRSWRPIVAALRGSYEIVTVDAPGHGGSTEVRADLWSGAALVAETCGDAAYVGYSMGGRLCLHVALLHPEVVRALVLVSTTAGLDDETARTARREADERRAAQLEDAGDAGLAAWLEAWLAQPMFAGLGDAAAVEDRLSNTTRGLASSLRLAGTGTQEPLWDRLAELRELPALVVAGERDAPYVATARRLVEGFGAGSELAVIAGAGHAAHLERPAEFAALLDGFLERRL